MSDNPADDPPSTPVTVVDPIIDWVLATVTCRRLSCQNYNLPVTLKVPRGSRVVCGPCTWQVTRMTVSEYEEPEVEMPTADVTIQDTA